MPRRVPRPATAAVAAVAVTVLSAPAMAGAQSLVLPGFQVNPNHDRNEQAAFSVSIDNVRDYPQYSTVDFTIKNREAWDLGCTYGFIPEERAAEIATLTENRVFEEGDPVIDRILDDFWVAGTIVPHEFSRIPVRLDTAAPAAVLTACTAVNISASLPLTFLVTPIVKGTETSTSGRTKEKGTPQPFDPGVAAGLAGLFLQSDSVADSPLGSAAPALGSVIDGAAENAASLQASSLNPVAGK